MEITKILYEERELAEVKNHSYNFSFFGMSEDVKKVIEEKQKEMAYLPPLTLKVNIKDNFVKAIGAIETDPIICTKYKVESFFRIWLENGNWWLVDGKDYDKVK